MSEALGTNEEAHVKARLRLDEGVESKMYKDSLGIYTIGIGRNLEKGLSPDEIEYLFANDFQDAERWARTFAPWKIMNEARRGVLVQMVFQMGPSRVAKFKRFLAAASAARWSEAAAEMLDSKWARSDSPARARRHARTMELGRHVE